MNDLVPVLEGKLALANLHLSIGNKALTKIENRRLIELFTHYPEVTVAFARYYPWDAQLIETFDPLIQWRELSRNPDAPWTLEFIESLKDFWDWQTLSANTGLTWSYGLLDRYHTYWDWHALSENPSLPWSIPFIDRYANYWIWTSDNDATCAGLSINPALPWTEPFINHYSDHWTWSDLQQNTGISWTLELLERFETAWDSRLSKNPALPWNEELIDQYAALWDWQLLSANAGIPWTEGLLDRYVTELNWGILAGNPALLQMIVRAWQQKIWNLRTHSDLDSPICSSLPQLIY